MNEFSDPSRDQNSENSINPFATPTAHGATTPPYVATSSGGLWRQGKALVMHKGARLPPLCVKTGVPVEEKGIVRTLSWHNPLIALSIFAGCLIYIILAVLLNKKFAVEIPMSPESRQKRKRNIILCVVLGFIGLVGFFGSIALMAERQTETVGLIGIISSGVLGVAAAMIGNSQSRILRPTKITDTHAWLRGVHPSIVDQLPVLPS